MNIERETDKLTRSLILAAEFTRKHQTQITTMTTGVYLLGTRLGGSGLYGWQWSIQTGYVNYTPNAHSNHKPFVKFLSDLAEEDFKDICNPTELELDVFKMVYGVPWVFDFREERKDGENTTGEDGNE